MKLLLDNGLPRSAASILLAQGVDAIHVGDIGLAAASDQAILDRASAERRVVITLDADFHTILAIGGARAPSVIRVRVEGLNGPEIASLTLRVVGGFAAELRAGAAISVGPRTARCHLLPLG